MSVTTFVAIALDLGTTSVKAALLDQNGILSNIVTSPSASMSSHDGYYESDALAYVAIAEQVLNACRAQAGSCINLGLCSQRSSFLLWEKSTGKPVTPLISWQDNRGAASCDALREHEQLIRQQTGLPLTPYYLAPKLHGLLQDQPEWRAHLECGDWLAGTLDTFLIWRWSSGRYFVTDASMAARTLLMDIHTQQWSAVLCELFGVPVQALPDIQSSAGLQLQLNNGLVLQANVADQSAVLLASMRDGESAAFINLGTGCFVIRPVSDSTMEPGGYLKTLVYQDSAQCAHFALEGTLNSIAAALEPYPFEQCRITDLAQDDIFCLAEPSGLGAPYFRGDIKIHFSRSVAHLAPQRIAALLLEAVVFRLALIVADFHRISPLTRVYLSGGLSGLASLQQGIAQCVSCDIYRMEQLEASLQGAALLAAGTTSVTHPEMKKIQLIGQGSALREKWMRWQLWLAEVLQSFSDVA